MCNCCGGEHAKKFAILAMASPILLVFLTLLPTGAIDKLPQV